ncbi:Ppx/GppA family phosphatase [Aceticella autotrophica]|uniref:Ppx/GppA family phosphatase n=1 Tax=Aceticella autotrophica TaxID=2755338 RepID=A0A975GAR4_9THEO|nr:Ppx/GppA phosphatase family protein [Aceticella autotrophica]QSZ27565.1 Ppx/GppA family phosphatase [Aceticella autotrophica]
MRYSVVDIGTNSIRHLICDVTDYKLFKIKKEVKTTRIGEGLAKNGRLSSDAIKRSIEAIKTYMEDAKKFNVDMIYAFATSAIRDAKNADVFIDELSNIGIDFDVIDGEKESLYGYLGALRGLNKDSGLVIDIGGGSTEFAYKGKGLTANSFDIGAVRLTEKFIKNDPPTLEEYNSIRNYIIDMLSTFINNIKRVPENIIGIGGTITSLAAVSQELKIYSSDKVHGYILNRTEIKRLLDIFMSKNKDERKMIFGLQEGRADIIIAGTVILLTSLELLNISSITVSEWDNLEGYIINKINSTTE